MAKHAINIQDGFLFQSLKEAREMRVSLVTGGQLGGRLKRFDRFAIVLEKDGQELLVYKHAIATIGAAAGRDVAAARWSRGTRRCRGSSRADRGACWLAGLRVAARARAVAGAAAASTRERPALPAAAEHRLRRSRRRRADAARRRGLPGRAARPATCAAARAAAAALLAADPGFAAAEVLRGQALLVAGDLAGAREAARAGARPPPRAPPPRSSPPRAPPSWAATCCAAYARLPRARVERCRWPCERAGDLHPAGGGVARRAGRGCARVAGRLDEARERLATLREWAPAEPADARGHASRWRAPPATRAASWRRCAALLAAARSGDEALLERRGELELEVGQPAAAIEIFEALAAPPPRASRATSSSSSAPSSAGGWPTSRPTCSALVDAPELSRADFAVLLYWLVPGVRAGGGQLGRASPATSSSTRAGRRSCGWSTCSSWTSTRRCAASTPTGGCAAPQALRALERVLQRASAAPLLRRRASPATRRRRARRCARRPAPAASCPRPPTACPRPALSGQRRRGLDPPHAALLPS